ncbi:MAG: DNA methyltransferase [Anaerolineales bacterium]|nr:DNA methyltransferase [Anaerolineales bacterium]
MKSYIQLKKTFREELPPEFKADDVRYAEGLVEYFVEMYTEPDGVVFDPFAGLGTTLTTAERMGRQAYGIEISESKVRYIRGKLQHPERLIHGDARQLANFDFPLIDLAITSPPFMSRGDPEDPLTDYSTKGKGYRAYLRDLRNVFGQLQNRIKPSGQLVIEVSNLKVEGELTTLAWDLGSEISRVLRFEGEIIVCWDKYDYGYDHSYCLVYSIV